MAALAATAIDAKVRDAISDLLVEGRLKSAIAIVDEDPSDSKRKQGNWPYNF
jgi:hypothetical protein